ncbi:hypothetical protein GOBAR_DD34268 [Gossypium barbadense]|nr:hypothetical protein GOBAR_DD34268 [Gossypium barbadense]
MGPSAPVTVSLRAKLSQPARSETKGRPSTPLDPNRATEERPTGGAVSDETDGGARRHARGGIGKKQWLLRLGRHAVQRGLRNPRFF